MTLPLFAFIVESAFVFMGDPLPQPFDERPQRTVTCCGQTVEVRGWPCPKCNGGYCPKCKDCTCDRRQARELPCQRCGVSYLPHLLEDGYCELCA